MSPSSMTRYGILDRVVSVARTVGGSTYVARVRVRFLFNTSLSTYSTSSSGSTLRSKGFGMGVVIMGVEALDCPSSGGWISVCPRKS